mmetsp:Transcript_33228/g.43787  ORF Transcript_33228/g.43787 Transcript_33228/m.43787 type:complete len:267 (+) Transcript_33228:90-890(+)
MSNSNEQSESSLRIAVGSQNPAKVKAVKKSFEQTFPSFNIIIESFSSESGVSDQPMDDDETRTGAMNRALDCSKSFRERNGGKNADYCIGLEGGVCEDIIASSAEGSIASSLYCCAWMAILQPEKSQWGMARTSSFPLPPAVVESIRSGIELGYACDAFFGTTGSKKELGAVGLLTGGLVDRIDYYAHALLMALIPFKNQKAFFEGSKTAAQDEDAQFYKSSKKQKLEQICHNNTGLIAEEKTRILASSCVDQNVENGTKSEEVEH